MLMSSFVETITLNPPSDGPTAFSAQGGREWNGSPVELKDTHFKLKLEKKERSDDVMFDLLLLFSQCVTLLFCSSGSLVLILDDLQRNKIPIFLPLLF